MDGIAPYIIGGIAAVFLRYLFMGANFRYRSQGYIEAYDFPESIREKVIERYPQLSGDDVQRAISALKTYFIICNHRNGQMVSMPSQVADVVWHEFILHTHRYKEFCDHGLGGFLHHTPASGSMGSNLVIFSISPNSAVHRNMGAGHSTYVVNFSHENQLSSSTSFSGSQPAVLARFIASFWIRSKRCRTSSGRPLTKKPYFPHSALVFSQSDCMSVYNQPSQVSVSGMISKTQASRIILPLSVIPPFKSLSIPTYFLGFL